MEDEAAVQLEMRIRTTPSPHLVAVIEILIGTILTIDRLLPQGGSSGIR